jgi:SAM-dependent methyltransferase
MSQSERWQLGGNAPEVYEREPVPAIFEPWAPLLVARAALQEGEHALDVACGTGVVARLAAAQVGGRGHVVGLDLNPGMLARARASSPAGGAAVEWQEGDAGAGRPSTRSCASSDCSTFPTASKRPARCIGF